MNPGKLNKRIYIMSTQEHENELLQMTHEFELFKSVRASVKASSRSEKQAESKNDKTNYTIIIRYFDGLDTTMRIMYQDKELEIVQIINVNEENKLLEITAIYEG